MCSTLQALWMRVRLLAGVFSVVLLVLLSPWAVRAQSGFDCTQVTDVPVSECEALVALYNSTGGPGWTRQTGWLSGTEVRLWSGVIVASGHVSGMHPVKYILFRGRIEPKLGAKSAMHLSRTTYDEMFSWWPPISRATRPESVLC